MSRLLAVVLLLLGLAEIGFAVYTFTKGRDTAAPVLGLVLVAAGVAMIGASLFLLTRRR